MTDTLLQQFEDSIITSKVASRFLESKEFTSPEALKDYLRDHPKADPSKHHVKELSRYNTKKPKEEKEESVGDLMRRHQMAEPRKLRNPPKRKEEKEESIGDLMRRHQKKPKSEEK
jgi:hypothetical protein